MGLKYLPTVILLLRNETPGHKTNLCLQLEGSELKKKKINKKKKSRRKTVC